MGYNTEIIVCDNGSTDGLPAELKKQKGELAWHGAGSMSS
jgi:glycosyltransferase involved in cell wall biosynthesis